MLATLEQKDFTPVVTYIYLIIYFTGASFSHFSKVKMEVDIFVVQLNGQSFSIITAPSLQKQLLC